MNKLPGALGLFLVLAGCKTPAAPDSALKDTGISVSSPRDQGGTAFCWSYALVAHIEQRYFELTRGADGGGGFRLNLSEEYLGLLHLVDQLVAGQPVEEGRILSETLDLVAKYGIVPEQIGAKPLFRASFDMPLARKVNGRANQDWADLGVAENSPLPPDRALNAVADAAQLTDEQRKFLSAVLGITDGKGAHFQFGNRDYTPQTFLKDRLKFDATEYTVLAFPDSGRGADGSGAFSPAYLAMLDTLKKAMLYGYSVPISINFVTDSVAKDGAVSCATPHCAASDIGTVTPDWPHANHAVLLIDYRTDQGAFVPVTAKSLEGSMKKVPAEWVMKNSWGFNYNTSGNKDLLKRFPLPAYTTMTQEFFEAGHWLRPDRFEAIVPKNVCLRELAPSVVDANGEKRRKLVCTPLVKTSGPDLTLDAPLLLGNLNQKLLARDPVERDPKAPVLKDDKILGVNLKVTAKETCVALTVGPAVRYVAAYFVPEGGEPENTPRLVFSADSKWKFCKPQTLEGPRTYGLVFEPLNGRLKALGRVERQVVVP